MCKERHKEMLTDIDLFLNPTKSGLVKLELGETVFLHEAKSINNI